MGDNHQTDNPLNETIDNRIERELKNNYHILYQIEKRLEEIANAVDVNTSNIDILEEAVSASIDIPSRPVEFQYNHRENKLWVNKRFYIDFDGKEADVFGLMFYKKTGLPKKTKFQCSEVAEKLSDHTLENMTTTKSIFQTVKRIELKLNTRLNTKNLLVIRTKEFYFSSK